MSLTIRSAARTDVGRNRELNEDSHLSSAHLFAVADGLGGHLGGEVASALAIDAVRPLADLAPARTVRGLADGVRAANRTILERSRKDPGLSGMATTFTSIVVHGDVAHLVHVGDSRAYRMRGGTLEQLSQDHTMVARLVRDGSLTPDEAERHPQRSMITRAVGSEPQVQVDEMEIPLAPGDRFLLCSDGLTDMLSDAEIAQIVREDDDPDHLCELLVDAANEHGGVDNITVVIIDVIGALDGTGEPVPDAAPAGDTPSAGRRVPKRALVWTAIVLALTVSAVAGLRVWANGSWYVGQTSGEVAVFRGLPMDVPLLRLHHVVQQTGIAVADLPEHLQREVREGIVADSLEHARRLVDVQIAPNAAAP